MEKIATFLPILNFILIGTYFFLFSKLMKSFPSEAERYGKEIKYKQQALISLFLFGLLSFAEDFYFKIIVAVLFLVHVIIQGELQHKKLKELHFAPDFIRKLRHNAYLGGGVLCFILFSFFVES